MTATAVTDTEADRLETIRREVAESRALVGLPATVEAEGALDAIARVLRGGAS